MEEKPFTSSFNISVLKPELERVGAGGVKEVIKKQPPAINLSAVVRRLLQGSNVAKQRPQFWSFLKSTNPAISSQLKSCLLLAQVTKSAKFGTKTVAYTLDGVKRGFTCTLMIKSTYYCTLFKSTLSD